MMTEEQIRIMYDVINMSKSMDEDYKRGVLNVIDIILHAGSDDNDE